MNRFVVRLLGVFLIFAPIGLIEMLVSPGLKIDSNEAKHWAEMAICAIAFLSFFTGIVLLRKTRNRKSFGLF